VVKTLERVEILCLLAALGLLLVQGAISSSRASAGFRCNDELVLAVKLLSPRSFRI
jgi:hypothetical protein